MTTGKDGREWAKVYWKNGPGTSGREATMETPETQPEVVRQKTWVTFPYGERVAKDRAAGAHTWGGFVALPDRLEGEVEYEIIITEIPEGVMAASAWLQEAEERVPIAETAQFVTLGIALDVRRGTLRVLGSHDFIEWPLPAGMMLILHW
jgi:hypothetical protein